jgi:hypothetical protein
MLFGKVRFVNKSTVYILVYSWDQVWLRSWYIWVWLYDIYHVLHSACRQKNVVFKENVWFSCSSGNLPVSSVFLLLKVCDLFFRNETCIEECSSATCLGTY